MSSSNSQKVRRNAASPSTRQGPLRATQQFALVGGGSPSRKHVVRKTPTSSPTPKTNKALKIRSHSETGFVSGRRSPISPNLNYRVEKPKALRVAGSLDNINLYLSGQWPKDGCVKQHKSQEGSSNSTTPTVSMQLPHTGLTLSSSAYYSDGVFKKDEHTQTPEEWEDGESKRQFSQSKFVLYKRSKSAGSGDNWSLKSRDIKAKLQRKDNSVRGSQPSTVQRFSPVPVISTALSPHSTQPIKIPVPTHDNIVLRGTPGKARASVEGLNQEIEKLIISATSAFTSTDEESNMGANAYYFDYPDGHRAPVPESLLNTRDMDTQTPSQSELFLDMNSDAQLIGDYRSSSRASTDTEEGSRPQSVSPSPFLLGSFDIDDPIPTDGVDSARAGVMAATSPRPNSAEFVRMPPDGAERLKTINERAIKPEMKSFLASSLMSTVKIQPSERSAFSSLVDRRLAGTALGSGIIPCRSPIHIVEESH